MTQKSVLITGCSKGGIGDALAQEFHSRGLVVFATARSLEKMQHFSETSITRLQLDVTSRESVEKVVLAVSKATGGSLDFLILNAGMHYYMPFADCDVAVARNLFETNVISIYTVVQPLLPLLIQAGGLISTVNSVNTRLCPPYQSAYNASKLAMQGLTETMRVELAPLGVRVVSVVTGAVETHLHEGGPELPQGSYYEKVRGEIASKKMMLSGWRQEPADYAKRVVGDLMRPKSAPWIWRGGMASVIWVLTSLMPTGWMDKNFIKQSSLSQVERPNLQQ